MRGERDEYAVLVFKGHCKAIILNDVDIHSNKMHTQLYMQQSFVNYKKTVVSMLVL